MKKIEQAVELLEAGQIDEAFILLEQIEQSNDLLAHYDVKDIYYQFGFYEQGISHVKNMLKRAPKDGELLVSLAAMYIDIEEDSEAIDSLLQVDENDPYYLSSLLMLADLYYVQGLFEVSEAKLFDAKKFAPDEVVVDFALAELFFSIGEYHRAIPFYEKISKIHETFDHVSVIERLAECYGTLGKYEEAYALYEKISSDDPNILFKHGYIANQLKQYQTAIQKWEQLLAVDPDYYSVYPELAKAYEVEGNHAEATKILQIGLEHDNFNKEIYLQLARSCEKQQNVEDAIQFAKEAIALDYDYKEAILFLVEMYKQQNDNEAVIDLLQEIIGTNSEDGDYDWELARAYEAMEEYDNAKTFYAKAHESLHNHADFLKEYGYFLVEEGLVKKAVSILNQYLNIVDDDEVTRAFVERLLS